MGYFQQRPEPLTVVLAQVWPAGKQGSYRTNYRGIEWPMIERVEASGDVPMHGIFHGGEGDVIVNEGDYMTFDPSTGEFIASSWYGFVGNYEEVPNAPA